MQLDLNTLINLGILGVLTALVRMVYDTRGDIRVIKGKLGLNGAGPGLVQEVENLRNAKHEHANHLHELRLELELLKQANESKS